MSPPRGARLAGVAGVALFALAAPAAAIPSGSPLAPAVFTVGGTTDGWLAQRVIDRSWGPSDDSLYRSVDVPGWKSEGLAFAASAVLPGTGQLYSGENSGLVFLVTEAAGWTGRFFAKRKADRYDAQASAFVGDPNDSAATFSFSRYVAATGADVSQLEQLWSADRDEYYRQIATDARYVPGFRGSAPENEFESYRSLRELREDTLHRSWMIDTALWINHLVAAFDALRAARNHDLPLREQYQLKLGERWEHGGPVLQAAVVRRF